MSATSRQAWFSALSWVRLDLPLRAAALTVASLDEGDGAAIGINRLGRVLGVSRQRSGLMLRELVELGLLTEVERRGGEAVYRLCLPAGDEATDATG